MNKTVKSNSKVNLKKKPKTNFIEKNKNLHEISIEYKSYLNDKNTDKTFNKNKLSSNNLNFENLNNSLRNKNRLEIKQDYKISKSINNYDDIKFKTIKYYNKYNNYSNVKPKFHNCFIKKKKKSNNFETSNAKSTIKPSICSRNISNITDYSRSYYKNINWMINKNNKIESLKSSKNQKELENCSFRPKINKYKGKNIKENNLNIKLIKNSKTYHLIDKDDLKKQFFNKIKETQSIFNNNQNYKKIYYKILNDN